MSGQNEIFVYTGSYFWQTTSMTLLEHQILAEIFSDLECVLTWQLEVSTRCRVGTELSANFGPGARGNSVCSTAGNYLDKASVARASTVHGAAHCGFLLAPFAPSINVQCYHASLL